MFSSNKQGVDMETICSRTNPYKIVIRTWTLLIPQAKFAYNVHSAVDSPIIIQASALAVANNGECMRE